MTDPGTERESIEADADGGQSAGDDAGAFVGHQPDSAQKIDIESTGPAGRGANPDEGWQRTPEGHREGRVADDDLVREKG